MCISVCLAFSLHAFCALCIARSVGVFNVSRAPQRIFFGKMLINGSVFSLWWTISNKRKCTFLRSLSSTSNNGILL